MRSVAQPSAAMNNILARPRPPQVYTVKHGNTFYGIHVPLGQKSKLSQCQVLVFEEQDTAQQFAVGLSDAKKRLGGTWPSRDPLKAGLLHKNNGNMKRAEASLSVERTDLHYLMTTAGVENFVLRWVTLNDDGRIDIMGRVDVQRANTAAVRAHLERKMAAHPH
jgi:hypothetical protein